MSKAGIHSNRGDSYQTLVAFDWALHVLTGPDYEWIEVDSTGWVVDDVVIGKINNKKICCQCKKNQQDHKDWTIANLGGELDKAISMLATDQQVEVRFYSRSPFGELSQLREYAMTQPDEESYHASLGKALLKVDAALKKKFAESPSLSTYAFLQRTTFIVTDEFDKMEELLRERLRNIASNPDLAYNALWTRLVELGARTGESCVANRHRLTKSDLKALLQQAGASLVPTMDLAEVRKSFASISAIGRSWRRDIAGQRIAHPAVVALLSAIDTRHKAILLTGLPGSGKTCVMLEVQDRLEELAKTRTDLVALFIQSRAFSDATTAQDREAQGLSVQWVEKIASMAEEAHVVIVIDSLDVLSIAREHLVLTYFLTQIDRLLLIPNVTVVTACRDFDRRYDKRIADRKWDYEWPCETLSWDADIAPLLQKLNIDLTSMNAVTRELIRNPLELALFVELAQRNGSFNAITSQALAQKYLEVVVQEDHALGDAAMLAIESIADEMLKSRCLAVPHQRFNASSEIQQLLRSNHVLHKTDDGKLIFGHQTLLDVLVISRALRNGMTLDQFIQNLPPVPFVRPSIRSFVIQLATGDRREFRKQLRTVMMSNAAFHIRRLVAQLFAEQKPEDMDWSLMCDLRSKHKEIFQVIYSHAKDIDWHHFWIKYLVPVLRQSNDVDGWLAHGHKISQWVNEDAVGVVALWTELLALDGIDNKTQIGFQIAHYIHNIDDANLMLAVPLLTSILDIPRQKHTFFGCAIARCVAIGCMDDDVLWRYITGDLSDSDVLGYGFAEKLHCQPYEFSDRHENFLAERMKTSHVLLDLAIQSIESWSTLRIDEKGAWMVGRIGFLQHTSYSDGHTAQYIQDMRQVDSARILLDAMEAAFHQHAQAHSEWWQINCQRLSSSHEGALRYFALTSCIASPSTNIDLMTNILSNRCFLTSDLSYECGNLLKVAFIHLDSATQDAVMATILTLWHEENLDEPKLLWQLKSRAELIACIPCYLRSIEAQALLSTYEKAQGDLIRQPALVMRGGVISAPFSFVVFLDTDDVVRLLRHYAGYFHLRDFNSLTGGEREVNSQLREAASRHPRRFLQILHKHWVNIPENSRNSIMDGAAHYLLYRYGNLQANDGWIPVEEPDANNLVGHIIDELERHSLYWHHNCAAAYALEACSPIINDTQEAGRLVFLALGFIHNRQEATISGGNIDLLSIGINMMRGKVASALMILINQFSKNNIKFSELLLPALRHFSQDQHPAIRAVILSHLPYLQSQQFEFGWELHELAMQGDAAGLWRIAESCFYYAYDSHFEKIAPLLERLHDEGSDRDLETWGRISALAALKNRIVFSDFLGALNTLDVADAWCGAAAVWTHIENINRHDEQCLHGLQTGLKNEKHGTAIAQKMGQLFYSATPSSFIRLELISLYFSAKPNISGFDKWLNIASQYDSEYALSATEIYLAYVKKENSYFHIDENNCAQILTRFFAEAEEREESDQGEMLQRVVAVQDVMLSLGKGGLDKWLEAAERP